MPTSLETLLSISSPALSTGPVTLPDNLLHLADALSNSLLEILNAKNGFFAFESALHFFAVGDAPLSYNLEEWNSNDLWKIEFGKLAEGYLFFAEDTFGEQFCIRDNKIWRFNPETADAEIVATSIEEWAKNVLNDYNVETGFSLAHDWQVKNGSLAPSDRLLPKKPFVLGGDFSIDNLYALDRVKGMKFRGNLAQQISKFPDKTKVKIKIVK